MSQRQEPPPTVITLILPTPEGGGIAPERARAVLLMQRGDTALVRQFHYHGYLPDLMTAIRDATHNLNVSAPPIPTFDPDKTDESDIDE